MNLTEFDKVLADAEDYKKQANHEYHINTFVEHLKVGEESLEFLVYRLEDNFDALLNAIGNNRYPNLIKNSIFNSVFYLEAYWAYESNFKYTSNAIEHLTDDRKEVARRKRRDYTRDDVDVLKNFKNQSEVLNLRPEQCLAVHMEKQFSAVITYINTEGESESEPIIKRIGDTLNYLELLLGILVERGEIDV